MNNSGQRAIVASPDAALRVNVIARLRQLRWEAEPAHGGAETVSMLEREPYAVVLLDKHLPDLCSEELRVLLHRRFPDTDIVELDGASASPPIAHFERNPRTRELRWALAAIEAETSPVNSAGDSSTAVFALPDFVGRSSVLEPIVRSVRLIAARKTAVLITGETGSGKEVVAHAIHKISPRRDLPFVVVNCATIPETLFESELFGYSRGAFTGAHHSKPGLVHTAAGGTLFLDEVGELPFTMQAKLLRLLDSGEVQRLGSTACETLDLRVIAATNRNLKGPHFREDLYYRLAAFLIEVVPLRSRRDDITLLSSNFISRWCMENGTPPKHLLPAATERLLRYDWPGNVRELRHVIERACVLSEGETRIGDDHIIFS